MAANFVNIMLLDGLNYFNRIIKKYDTLTEYQALGTHSYSTSLNFDPGNGLQTTLVIGTQSTSALNFDANYLLVYTTVSNVSTISQRWWVMDQKRTRSGQYTLSLKRDVIADFQDIIVDSPCFIEKAKIRDFTNPLLFNREDMTFNQIKKSETLLQDETKMAWIVGYVARSYTGGTITSVYDVRTDYTDATLPFAAGTYKSASNIKLNLFYDNKVYYQGVAQISPTSKSYIQFTNNEFDNYNSFYKELQYRSAAESSLKAVYYNNYYLTNPAPPTWRDVSGYLELVGNYIKTNKATVASAFNSTYSYRTQEDMDTISNMAGKTYRDTNTGKYYKIRVSITAENKVLNVQATSAFGVAIDTGIRKPVVDQLLQLTDNYYNVGGYTTIDCYEKTIVMTLEEYTPTALSINLSSSRNRLNDAPYDMFCIPYPLTPTAVFKTYTNYMTFTYFEINRDDALHIAESIGAQLGTNVYDIQILPYCPISNIMGNFEVVQNVYEDHISLLTMTSGKDYSIVSTITDDPDDSKEVGIIFWGTSSSRTFNITHYITVENPKIDNETKLYRLVSPNYSGMFEFSPAMNNGVDYFNVDITYKPYNPYIHVNPNFKFMYGGDYNDARGLICGGDFSVAICDDKWANFQINNKNYQLIFDREVQNMEFTRGQARVGEAFDLITGTAAGAIQGSAGGVAGAIAGGVAAAAGGITDIAMNEAKYKEQLSLKKDLYGYNLGNIRALPSSLTKSMSLNENFKFWPFLEEYECSEIEKEAFILKIQYDGMTIMKIGKISDYLAANEETFIKGQMIRLLGLEEAADVAYEIFNEIKRGVYI